MEQSIFAKALQDLLDDTNIFSRREWADLLRVSEETLNAWVSDLSLPRPDHLGRIVLCITEYDVPQGKAIAFKALFQRPFKEISHAAKKGIPIYFLVKGKSEDDITLDDYINTPLAERQSVRS